MINFEHFKSGENDKFLFLQLPLLLIKDDIFKKLSSDAKILYSLLLNRTSLSARNGWVDDNNNIYIIYTIEQIMEDLNCWEQKAVKAMKELKEIGLVKSIRQGLGKPNITYVMNFSSVVKPDNTLNCENHNSGIVKTTIQEPPKITIQELRYSQCSYIDLNNNDLRDIENHSQSQTELTASESTDETLTETLDAHRIKHKKEPSLTAAVQSSVTESPLAINETYTSEPVENKYITYRRIIQENIEYTHYAAHRSRDIEIVNELVSCMLDVICTEGATVKVNSEDKSREMVKSQYLKINSMDIDHIINKFREQRHTITHVHSYLKTMLYTVKQEMSAHYDNAVRADGVI